MYEEILTRENFEEKTTLYSNTHSKRFRARIRDEENIPELCSITRNKRGKYFIVPYDLMCPLIPFDSFEQLKAYLYIKIKEEEQLEQLHSI